MSSETTTRVRVPVREPRHRLRHNVARAASAILEGPSQAGVRDRDRLFRRALAWADAIAAGLALLVAVSVLGDDRLRLASIGALPLALAVSKVIGIADRDCVVLRRSTLDEAPELFQLATLYALATWLLQGVLIDGHLSQLQVAGLWFVLFAMLVGARAAARALVRSVAPAERCLLLGEPQTTQRIARKLAEVRGIKTTVVASLPLGAADAASHQRAIERAVRAGAVHRVILAPRGGESDDMLEVIRLVKALGVKVSVLPRILEVVGSSAAYDTLHGLPVLAVRRFGLSRPSWRLKRSIDVTGALVGLIACAPIMVAIALAIRLDTPGSVLFRQKRVGRGGRHFALLKFRTMVDGADALKDALRDRNETEGLFKIADDPRITRVGAFLRRTSLDELPQLVNVLRGEMSLVGPRPLVVDEDARIEGWQRRRLDLTPGMTGPWQVLGSARVPLAEMATIDYLYVAGWSLWTDVKILLRTVGYMAGRGGL
jgi:exopolysaccharide biosynthesis polyprenyl glycosylphosphotransferase